MFSVCKISKILYDYRIICNFFYIINIIVHIILLGDRQMIANATGCSSIYSASIPSTPYTKNEKGQGPVFNNSLFEDFCEFGLGMALGNKKMKERVAKLLQEMIESDKTSAEYKELAQEWIANKDDAAKEKGESNCPLYAIGHDSNHTKIWELKDMDADHVTAWSKGGATDISNCQMLYKTHNRAKGNR